MNDSLSTPSDPAAPFKGWTEAAQRFFIGLELDNSKSYFEANRELYACAVRGPMEALLAELQPEFGPGKIFRINRDIRFSADKSPYKTHIGAWAGDSGKGGYVQLSARGLYAAAGPYIMDPSELERFRAAVADEQGGCELEGIVAQWEADGYEVGGEALRVVPRGYPRDHPRTRLLKHKGLYIGRDFGLQAWLGTAQARHRVAEVWRDSQTVNAWLVARAGWPRPAG